MMNKIAPLAMALFLAACAGDPPVQSPPLRMAADNANRAAVAATAQLRWEAASESWRDALQAYQSIDDWSGQGRARLGLAQTLARLGKADQAAAMIVSMPEQSLFPQSQRAQAAYQLAMLVLPADVVMAQSLQEKAVVLCAKDCALHAPLANLAARLAAKRQDWVAVQQHASRALSLAQAMPVERAHARRWLAEAALEQKHAVLARSYLDAALIDDRALADPVWLAEDYRLLLRVASDLNDKTLLGEATLRLQRVCAMSRVAVCSEYNQRHP